MYLDISCGISRDTLPIWSKGIAAWADFNGGESYWSAPTESQFPLEKFKTHYSKMSGIVWVRLGSHGDKSDLNRFVEILDQIDRPIILLSTDGDASVPSSFDKEVVQKISSHPLIKSWYTQNYDGSNNHNKIKPFPIGLDLHTLDDPTLSSPLERIVGLTQHRDDAEPNESRFDKMGCDLNISISSPARKELLMELKGAEHIDFLRQRVCQNTIWWFYSQYPIVLNTHGNGLDCHRT